MTKYRPIKGRSIRDVRAEDLIALPNGFVFEVVAVNRGWVWYRFLDSDLEEQDGSEELEGSIENVQQLVYGKFCVVELIPELKTKVSYMPFLGAGASTIICRSLDDVRHNLSGTYPIFKIISTDDGITSVELVKDE